MVVGQVPKIAESASIEEEEHQIDELEAEIDGLRTMMRKILNKKRLFKKEFKKQQLRWYRVYNNFRIRLVQAEKELDELEMKLYGVKIDVDDFNDAF